MYSQSFEEQYLVEYFGDIKGNLLSIGENDGKTLSNSLRLIELGWSAVLVEPSPSTFLKLVELHVDNNNVTCCKCAIGNTDGKMTFYESGHHYKDKSDFSLLSTLDKNETKRWDKVVFTEIEVDVRTYDTFCKGIDNTDFDFITIDAEGYDLMILKQIDLSNTMLLCIEYNSIESTKAEILKYCLGFGLNKVIYISGENLIIGR